MGVNPAHFSSYELSVHFDHVLLVQCKEGRTMVVFGNMHYKRILCNHKLISESTDMSASAESPIDANHSQWVLFSKNSTRSSFRMRFVSLSQAPRTIEL